MSTATATAESTATEPAPAAPSTPASPAALRALTDRLAIAGAFVTARLLRAVARARIALDLPSATELAAVNARLEAVEAQLAAGDDDGDDDRRRRRRRG